jgi:hypothetical protein
MKKYLSIFNFQTLLVTGLSLLSCYVSIRFQLKIYADFLIIGIIIVFPLTFTMREAFKRRERSIQYLSLLKSSLQSVFYSLQNTKLEDDRKAEFRQIADNVSQTLLAYLSGVSTDIVAVEQASQAIVTFIQQNKKETKKVSLKILLFVSKINESIEYLLAVRRHYTPWGPRAIVLFAIYAFAIFYPPATLYETGFDLQVWNLFLATGFKVLILISMYNVQVLMEDPFNENTPDGIRLNDFRFHLESIPLTALNTTVLEAEIK